MTCAWYVLRSKPNKEDFLWRQVMARQMENFYPAVRAKVVNPRARKIKPYFPGYLFVKCDLHVVPLSLWLWIPGSRGLVLFGETPAEVPELLIEAIRRKVAVQAAAGGDLPVGLKPGDSVTISSGPFADYAAVFDGCISGNDRVRVLLRHLKDRLLPVELPVGQIEATNRSA